MREWILVSMFVMVALPGWAQEHHGLHTSARDAFWSASDLIAVTPNPAAHRVVKPRPSKPTSGSADAAPATPLGAEIDPAPTPSAGESGAHTQAAVLLASDNGYGAAPHLLRATESRLGLRYSVLLRGDDSAYTEVLPGTVFHSGDHIKLSLMANEPGYLYVIQKGSSGSWSPIFPAVGGGVAHIEQGKLQEVPDGTKSFLFDQRAGDERLFVILSKTPITDLDRRIANLREAQPSPSVQPPSGEQMPPVVEAENHIPDLFVQQMATRDLTLVDEEKVDQAPTANHGGEKAVYVVSKAGAVPSTGEEIVASIILRHE